MAKTKICHVAGAALDEVEATSKRLSEGGAEERVRRLCSHRSIFGGEVCGFRQSGSSARYRYFCGRLEVVHDNEQKEFYALYQKEQEAGLKTLHVPKSEVAGEIAAIHVQH